MKVMDGLFAEVFRRVGKEYILSWSRRCRSSTSAPRGWPPGLSAMISYRDSTCNGDIISDVTAELTGSVELAGSANIGDHVACSRPSTAVRPDIAGKGIANPAPC